VKTDPAGVKFVILTSPRCGSTWLVSLLNQMEGASVFGELFLPRRRSGNWDAEFAYPRFIEARVSSSRLRPLEVYRYLDALYDRPGVVGFKLMYSQLRRYPELLPYFWLKRVRVVHLVRSNPLDLLISKAIKRKVQRAHRLSSEPALDGMQVELDPHTLVERLKIKQRKMARGRSLLRWSGLRQMELGYEDLRSGEQAFRTLCEFLSIPSGGEMPESKFQKVRRGSQGFVLKNYSEVRQTLEGTPFQAYLE
jgi:LPS sulfotransferase NodH